MEVILKAKPKKSFEGELRTGYTFNFMKSNKYSYEIDNNVYYVADKYGYKIPFTKEDFDATFVAIN